MNAMRDAYDTLIAGIYYETYDEEKADKMTERCLNWLSTTDFYIAPASTIYHDAEPCGLLRHTLRVVDKMMELLSLSSFSGVTRHDAILTALVHDWCKMKIYCSYMGKAWLLSKSGQSIEVLNHPSETFEFESVVDVIVSYGSASEKSIAKQYLEFPTEKLKNKLLDIYNNNWCKVRTWGTFQEEITFRITSAGYNWYNTIVNFLLDHPEFKRSEITVESNKSSGSKYTYWERVGYNSTVDSSNESILAASLVEE